MMAEWNMLTLVRGDRLGIVAAVTRALCDRVVSRCTDLYRRKAYKKGGESA